MSDLAGHHHGVVPDDEEPQPLLKSSQLTGGKHHEIGNWRCVCFTFGAESGSKCKTEPVADNRLTVTTLSRSSGSGCPPIQAGRRKGIKQSLETHCQAVFGSAAGRGGLEDGRVFA